VVTRTLLVGGEGGGGRPLLHAYDKKTGESIADVTMPGSQTAVPMTYMYQNRQFIVMAVAGQPAGQLVAFALPVPGAGPGGGRGRGAGAAGAN
jgi:quinoprotein glucose dehydrogenase